MSTAGPLPRAKHRSPQGEGYVMSTAGPLPRAKRRSPQGEGYVMSTAGPLPRCEGPPGGQRSTRSDKRGGNSSTGLRIGFIGAGRLGKALAWSFEAAGLQVTAVASSNPASAHALAGRIEGCQALPAQAVVDACDLIFLTTPDSAITPTCASLRWRAGVSVVHCSGVTEVDALHAAREQGAAIGGFHPMQTFGDPAAAVASLPGSTITIEAGEPLNATLVDLARQLECRVNRLPPGMRARYHAAAGFTSQFINALFAEAARVWESWGATEAQALQAMLPMARGTLASIESAGIAAGMPGPVSRGDVGSVEKHVAALAELSEHTLNFYRTLCTSTIALAVERGSIDEATARRLREVLG